MKGCDVNKDIQIDDMAQVTLPDIQIPIAERAFRDYVKQIDNKAYYRVEESLTLNESVSEALEKLRIEINMDDTVLSL